MPTSQQTLDLLTLDLPGATGDSNSPSPVQSGGESPVRTTESYLPPTRRERQSHFANGGDRRCGMSQLSLGGGCEEAEMTRSAAALADLRHLVEARPKLPPLVLMPNDMPRLALDIVVVLATVLAGIFVPLGLTYLEPDKISSGVLGALLQVIDVVFALDVLANLRTGFATMDRVEVRPLYIAARYLRRGMVFDMLAVWPAALAPEGAERVIWTLKLLRLMRLVPLIAKLQKELRLQGLAGARIGIVVALLCHILSCAWRLTLRADSGELGARWTDEYVEDMYWVLMTMTTVGYGDIGPRGTKSRLYAVFAMLIAPIFSGTIVSALTHTTRSLFEDRTEELVAQVTVFMKDRRLPMEIQQRVQRNLRTHLQREHCKALDPKLFALLSPSMQKELSLALVSSTVLQFPLFRGAQHSFVAELAQAHSWIECLPGDLVAEEGQLVCELVFVILGRLAMQLPPELAFMSHFSSVGPTDSGDNGGKVEVEVEAGAWFGEESLFSQGAIRAATVVSVVDSELAVLNAGDYTRIVRKYPRLMDGMEDMADTIEASLAKGIDLHIEADKKDASGDVEMAAVKTLNFDEAADQKKNVENADADGGDIE